MKAAVVNQFGGADVLRYQDVPDPVPGDSDVLIKVAACGVNRSDTRIRAGRHWRDLPLPHILGSEIAGMVAGVGPGVEPIPVGTRVVVLPWISCDACEPCQTGMPEICRASQVMGWERAGGYAEYVTAPAKNLLTIPPGVDPISAAALTLSAVTARHMVSTIGRVIMKDVVLVLAGGSGLGAYVVKLAQLAGAAVFATAGSDAKLAKLNEMGVEPIDHRDPEFGKKVRSLTGGRGVDVVFEQVGPATWEQSLTAVAAGGRIIVAGTTSGERVSFDLLRLYGRQIQMLGALRGRMAELETVLQLAAIEDLTPSIDRVLPMAEAAEAHRALEDREVFGKIILTP